MCLAIMWPLEIQDCPPLEAGACTSENEILKSYFLWLCMKLHVRNRVQLHVQEQDVKYTVRAISERRVSKWWVWCGGRDQEHLLGIKQHNKLNTNFFIGYNYIISTICLLGINRGSVLIMQVQCSMCVNYVTKGRRGIWRRLSEDGN